MQLTYESLKREAARNELSEEDLKRMWKPFKVFRNIEHGGEAKAADKPNIIMIVANEDFTYKYIPPLPKFYYYVMKMFSPSYFYYIMTSQRKCSNLT